MREGKKLSTVPITLYFLPLHETMLPEGYASEKNTEYTVLRNYIICNNVNSLSILSTRDTHSIFYLLNILIIKVNGTLKYTNRNVIGKIGRNSLY